MRQKVCACALLRAAVVGVAGDLDLLCIGALDCLGIVRELSVDYLGNVWGLSMDDCGMISGLFGDESVCGLLRFCSRAKWFYSSDVFCLRRNFFRGTESFEIR